MLCVCQYAHSRPRTIQLEQGVRKWPEKVRHSRVETMLVLGSWDEKHQIPRTGFHEAYRGSDPRVPCILAKRGARGCVGLRSRTSFFADVTFLACSL